LRFSVRAPASTGAPYWRDRRQSQRQSPPAISTPSALIPRGTSQPAMTTSARVASRSRCPAATIPKTVPATRRPSVCRLTTPSGRTLASRRAEAHPGHPPHEQVVEGPDQVEVHPPRPVLVMHHGDDVETVSPPAQRLDHDAEAGAQIPVLHIGQPVAVLLRLPHGEDER